MADDVNWAEAVENQEREVLEKGVASLSVILPSVHEDEDDKPMSEAEASLLTKILRTKLIPIQHDVEVMRSDPTSPLYSAKSFEELHL